MPKPGVVVDQIARLDRASQTVPAGLTPIPPGPTLVRFKTGVSGELNALDTRSPIWEEVLDELRADDEPVYCEIDPNTRVIQQVLIPQWLTVARVAPQPEDDRREIELSVSHAYHYLNTKNPDYAALLKALQDAERLGALVLITETLDDHEIIDVRSPLVPFAVAAALAAWTTVPAASVSPCSGLAPITPARAAALFSMVQAPICALPAPVAPCIPFNFPDDGCWARAHEMASLIAAGGGTACKTWIYGTLHVGTRYHPTCSVRWGWHVAPCVDVNTGSAIVRWVIDPSVYGPSSRGNVDRRPNPRAHRQGCDER